MKDRYSAAARQTAHDFLVGARDRKRSHWGRWEIYREAAMACDEYEGFMRHARNDRDYVEAAHLLDYRPIPRLKK